MKKFGNPHYPSQGNSLGNTDAPQPWTRRSGGKVSSAGDIRALGLDMEELVKTDLGQGICMRPSPHVSQKSKGISLLRAEAFMKISG